MAESKMTPKERAAMQQALEALESYSKSDYIKKQHPKRRANGEKAITALREALAEQATVSDGLCGGCAKKAADGWALYCVECWEQAEQEPVAYVLWDDNNVPSLQWEKPNDGVFNQLYYAAPVRTKDLTDDEILEITKRFALGIAFPVGGATTPEMFARAVIAADREKNK